MLSVSSYQSANLSISPNLESTIRPIGRLELYMKSLAGRLNFLDKIANKETNLQNTACVVLCSSKSHPKCVLSKLEQVNAFLMCIV